jgi:hypothetical protein
MLTPPVLRTAPSDTAAKSMEGKVVRFALICK